MLRQRRITAALTVIAMAVLLGGWACSTATKNLATASDAIAHSLQNAQTAPRQGVTDGVIASADEAQFEVFLTRVSQAGIVLDQGIRANESATTLSAKVNSFLDAFNQLNTSGVAGIKDPKLKLAISTIITGAESSVAIIAATVGK